MGDGAPGALNTKGHEVMCWDAKCEAHIKRHLVQRRISDVYEALLHEPFLAPEEQDIGMRRLSANNENNKTLHSHR